MTTHFRGVLISEEILQTTEALGVQLKGMNDYLYPACDDVDMEAYKRKVVLGYGNTSEEAIAIGIKALAKATGFLNDTSR